MRARGEPAGRAAAPSPGPGARGDPHQTLQPSDREGLRPRVKRFIFFHDKQHPADTGAAEVGAVLQQVTGIPRIMALLLYGAGLRVLECCRLRVKDRDCGTHPIVVRDGKGRKDRVTMLPAAIIARLRTHFTAVQAQHQADLR